MKRNFNDCRLMAEISAIRLFGLMLVISGFARGAGAEMTLDEIVENVRRNEGLYDNLDVTVHWDYSIGDRKPPTLSGGIGSPVIASNSRVHFVRQNGLFRVDRSGSTNDTTGTSSLDHQRTFDGTTTRLLDAGVGNVQRGAYEDRDVVRPHMYLLRSTAFAMVPLSSFLSGTAAMLAIPSSGLKKGQSLRSSYAGLEVLRGTACHKVSVELIRDNGKPRNRIELWLAEDKNYLPVRSSAFMYRFSQSLHTSQGETLSFKEIEPGIWFPTEAEVVGYDEIKIEEEHRQVADCRHRFITESVSLHPSYAPSFFADISFPDGTAVYELEAGHIRKSYRQGQPASTGAAPSRGGGWLFYLNVAVLSAAIWYAWARSHRRSENRVRR